MQVRRPACSAEIVRSSPNVRRRPRSTHTRARRASSRCSPRHLPAACSGPARSATSSSERCARPRSSPGGMSRSTGTANSNSARPRPRSVHCAGAYARDFPQSASSSTLEWRSRGDYCLPVVISPALHHVCVSCPNTPTACGWFSSAQLPVAPHPWPFRIDNSGLNIGCASLEGDYCLLVVISATLH